MGSSSCPDQSSATSHSAGYADLAKCNLKQLHNGLTQHKLDQVQVQPQKHVSWDLSNANFMSEQDPETLRAQFNIPKGAPINMHYTGESPDSDIVNAFGSRA